MPDITVSCFALLHTATGVVPVEYRGRALEVVDGTALGRAKLANLNDSLQRFRDDVDADKVWKIFDGADPPQIRQMIPFAAVEWVTADDPRLHA